MADRPPAVMGRAFLALSGLGLVAWAVVDPRFRDPEGALTGAFCLPLAIGVSLAVAAWVARPGLRRAAFWLALAWTGHAATLQLIDAGPRIHYQHYLAPGDLVSRDHLVPALLLAAQTALVLASLARIRSAVLAWLRRTFRWWQLVIAGLVIGLLSAAPSRDLGFYAYELCFATFVHLVQLGTLVLFVAAVPRETREALRRRIRRRISPPARRSAESRTLVLAGGAALFVFACAAVLVVFSYERHPHLPDEVAHLLQARYLAHGALSMPAPPVPAAFDIDIAIYDPDRWYSPVPPGWPLILALGVILGIPWLVNPLLGGVGIVLAYFLVQRIYDRRTSLWLALLLAASPWYLFLSMSLMTHLATLVAGLLAALAFVRLWEEGRARWAWLSGAMLGALSLIRQMDALALATVLGVAVLFLRPRRRRLPALAGLAASALLVGAAILPYHAHLTGDPLTSPMMTFWSRDYPTGTNALGFGPDRGWSWGGLDPFPGHGPRDVVVNAVLNASSIDFELFGWSTGSLLPLVLLLLWGEVRARERAMLGVLVAVIVAYGAYWFSGGPDFGARYWFLVIVPAVVLTVGGLRALARRLEAAAPAAILPAVLVLVLSSMLNVVPWRAIDKYHHYRGMRPDIRRLAEERGFGRSLVLIRGERFPDYSSAVVYNPLELDAAAPIFAWEKTPEVARRVRAAFPDRPVWTVDGPTVTGRGFAVAAGPEPSP